MSTTHTPKSLVFVSLGIGLALLLIIIPVWLGDNREIVDVGNCFLCKSISFSNSMMMMTDN